MRLSRWKFPLYCYLLALSALLLSQAVFAVVNHSFFHVGGFVQWLRIILGNIHFALSATTVYLAPFLLFLVLPLPSRGSVRHRRLSLWPYGIGVALMLAVNIADTPYFQWTFRRLSSDIFSYLSQGFGYDGTALLPVFTKQFWPYLLYFVVLTASAILLARRHAARLPEDKPLPLWQHSAVSVVALALALLLVRGGLFTQHKPLAAVDAGRYADPDNTALVINSPFSLYRSMGHSGNIKPLNYFDEAVLDSVYTPVTYPSHAIADSAMLLATPSPNIVLVILESFSEEYMGCLNGGGISYTPFLDSLYPNCLTFRGLANGKRSIESLPALLEGIPSLMDYAFITSPFSLNRVSALPSILQRHGYSTAMFHGAYNGSMNFDSFAKTAGISRYYGMDQYDGPRSDYDGTWGIFDEPFLQYTVRQLDTFREPFFAAVYTISSHHPYTIPSQHEGRFKQGPIPLLQTIGYADYALRQFFVSASTQPWFSNTLFIITADHAAQPLSDDYRSGLGLYRVPMMFYTPSNALTPSHSQRMFQHCDLTPTLLDMLSLNEPCCCFGTSALRGGTPFHIVYTGDAIVLNRGDGSAASLCGDKLHSTDTVTSQLLQAILQQYNNRLLQNRMTP